MLNIAPRLADIVFPEVMFERRLIAWWVIGFGLLVELPFVRLITGFSFRRCLVADFSMNAVSTLAGLLLIPLLGLGWELSGSSLFGQTGFEWVHWIGTFMLAVALNSVIELWALHAAFKQKFDRRGFLWLCVANALSVGLALGTLFHYPPKL